MFEPVTVPEGQPAPDWSPLASRENDPTAGYDEVFSAPGAPHPHWRAMLDHLYSGGPDLPGRLREETDRLLRESGVTFNVFGNAPAHGEHAGPGPARRWPLDPIPLLVDAGSWGRMSEGLLQRHRLLTRIHQDLHGPRNCLRDGIIPCDLVLGSADFLMAVNGGDPEARPTPLPLYAVDLARGPDGGFVVLADRAQAPSGYGYVLQNRRVMNRLFAGAGLFDAAPALLPFFRAMRSNLVSLARQGRHQAHVVLLTPGPESETYFEHALLAHFLGLTLAQGGDLAVRFGRVWLKTLGGLLPVEVVLRRLDEAFCDPLELREESLLGVVGLVQAARSGRVALANALGTGILENLALHAYLPALANYFLGEPLRLPNPQTWWLGDPRQRAEIADQLGDLAILPVEPGAQRHPGRCGDATALRSEAEAHPERFVARRPLDPSTTPCIQEDRIVQRPVLIRAFLSADSDQAQVMPGGMARISPDPEGEYFSPGWGGVSKDIWIIADQAVEVPAGIIHAADALDPAPLVGVPSRLAENLFWMGRYAERCEGAIRLFREFSNLHSEETGLSAAQREHCRRILLVTFTHVTGAYPGFVGEEGAQSLDAPDAELASGLLDDDRVGSLAFSLRALIQAAFSVRDRLSLETWGVVDAMARIMDRAQRNRPRRLNTLFWEFGPLLQGLTAFSGLLWENTHRDLGWRFLDMGRRLERAMFLTHLLESALGAGGEEANETAVLERLLALNDSLQGYRMHYQARLAVAPVLEKLLQEDRDPRAMVFQLDLLETHAREAPRGSDETFYRTHLGRVIFETLAAVRLADPVRLAQVDPESGEREELAALLTRVRQLLPLFSESASNSYFQHAAPPHHLFRVDQGEA